MDKLEKFIGENREEFDDKLPSDQLWHKINSRLDNGGRQVLLRNHIWKAAVIFLLSAVIWLLVDRQDKINQINLTQIETTDGIVFKEVEDYYFSLIEIKQRQIRTFVAENPELDKQLISDIDKLDSSYVELKKELIKGPNQKVIDAMIVNLQTRMEILNQQLSVLERIKNLKDKEDETKNI